MAYKMTKRGSQDNETTNEFFCDTMDDRNAIPASQINLGSIAVVLKPTLQIFIAGSDKEWNSMIGTSNTETEEEEEILQFEISRLYEDDIKGTFIENDVEKHYYGFYIPYMELTENQKIEVIATQNIAAEENAKGYTVIIQGESTENNGNITMGPDTSVIITGLTGDPIYTANTHYILQYNGSQFEYLGGAT